MSDNNISEMNKDDLATFALAELGLEIDKHKPLKELRAHIKDALAKKNGAAQKSESKVFKAKFLKHPENGRVYLATKHLLSRGDMIPCDKDGNTVSVADDE